MLEPLDYYAAGIIDGEGTITMTPKLTNSQYRIPIVSVSSTTIEILEFLKSRYGGTISVHKVYQEHHKQSWSWKITYNAVIDLCERLGPLLLETKKRYRANLLATKYKSVTKRNGRYTEAERLLRLDFEREFFESSD